MAKKRPKECESPDLTYETECEPENQQMPEEKEVKKNDIKSHSKFSKFKRGELKLNGNE